MGNRDYGKKSSVTKMADGGEVGTTGDDVGDARRDAVARDAFSGSDENADAGGNPQRASEPAPSTQSNDTSYSDYGDSSGRGAPGTSEATTAAPAPARQRRAVAMPAPSTGRSGGFAGGLASGLQTGAAIKDAQDDASDAQSRRVAGGDGNKDRKSIFKDAIAKLNPKTLLPLANGGMVGGAKHYGKKAP